jgi:hypothetical protein
MSEFGLYLQLGLNHIADISAYDHIVFLMALGARYQAHEWKKILILITAFTIGHSLTLALATFKVVVINSKIIEFLIPVTILMTCLYNVFSRSSERSRQKIQLNYILALVFGFIHGMGFSNYLQAILGKEESITLPLLSFNLGIEIGQIIIMSLFFVILFIFEQLLRVRHRDWNIFVSGMAAGISLILMNNTVFW